MQQCVLFERLDAVAKKSLWSFSGRHWAGWTATWAGLIAAVVSFPGAPDKHLVMAPTLTVVHSSKAQSAPSPAVSVKMRGIDFGDLPPAAFGDYDPERDRR